MERRNWTREELILAYNLYCKIPYGQFNTSSIDVKELAQIIGRTPGAVAFKLVNFVSLDPRQKLLGRKGATNIGKLDKEIFEEFSTNFDEMFYESENLLSAKSLDFHKRGNVEIFVDNSKKGEYKIRETKVRVNQDYFRTLVLSNYSNICSVTGIKVPELLIASHIKPWSKDEKNRLNPSNGICLSATFDKAFDKGLISIDKSYNILFSSKLKKYSKENFYQEELSKFESRQIIPPMKFLPNEEFLIYHNDVVFQP
ncbi:MAG: HNH endonuclease [Saprospiraceae bacterium]|nr:HNH endonuclease [Saprospiraceae bacterium]